MEKKAQQIKMLLFLLESFGAITMTSNNFKLFYSQLPSRDNMNDYNMTTLKVKRGIANND